ncbi:MAG: efflux RND transporter periplasmic adaptor subunit [Ignavibacteriaceae bacterium]
MKKYKKILLPASIIFFVVAVIFLFLLNREDSNDGGDQKAPAKTNAMMSNGKKIIKIDSLSIAANGIIIKPLQLLSYGKVVKGYGRILNNNDMSSWIDKYESAKSNFLTAEADFNKSNKEYQRLKKINELSENNISLKAIQSAEAALQTSKAVYENFNISFNNLKQTIKQYFGEGLANWILHNSPSLQKVLKGNLYIAQISLPDDTLNTNSINGCMVETTDKKFVKGNFISRSMSVDPEFQGRNYFFAVEPTCPVCGKGTNLSPGMIISADITTGALLNGVVIPYQAIVWQRGEAWAYFELGKGQFFRKIIPTGAPAENGYFVPDNNLAGNNIVLEGSQFLLSEENLSQIKTED